MASEPGSWLCYLLVAHRPLGPAEPQGAGGQGEEVGKGYKGCRGVRPDSIGLFWFCLLGPVPPTSSSWPQLGQVHIDPTDNYFPETSLEDLDILVLGLGVCLVLRARNIPRWGHSKQDRSSCPVLLKHLSGR